MPLIPPEDQARETVEDLRRVIPTEIREIQIFIDKARVMQRRGISCDKCGIAYPCADESDIGELCTSCHEGYLKTWKER